MTNELTKTTVNLTPRSVAALTAAAVLSGDTRTDTINRSIQMYDYITGLQADGWKIVRHRGDVTEEVTFA